MSRFVETNLGAARDPDATYDAPALVTWRLRDFDALGGELSESRVEVSAHQVQLLGRWSIARMCGELSRRQREDQPATSGVGEHVAELVAEESPDLLGVRGIEDGVDSSDHTADVTAAKF